MTTSAVLIIPCALLMIACARPILEIIFEGGRFGPEETLACLPLTRILLLPAPVWIIYMVLVRGFYSHEDSLTPAITGTIVTLLCIPAYYFIAVPLGAPAIAAVSGLGLAVYLVWLAAIWIRRHGPQAFSGLIKNSLAAFAISAPGAAAAFFVCDRILIKCAIEPPFFMALLKLAAAGAVFAVLTLGLIAIFKPADLIEGLVGIRAKIFRRN